MKAPRHLVLQVAALLVIAALCLAGDALTHAHVFFGVLAVLAALCWAAHVVGARLLRRMGDGFRDVWDEECELLAPLEEPESPVARMSA